MAKGAAAELEVLEDGALMVLFANGEALAARILTDRLLPGAFRHAARVLGDRNEAEDVAQEAMMRLWKMAADWKTQEAGAKPSTWLYKVVANLCVDHLRRSGRLVALRDDDFADAALAVEERLQDKDRLKALDEALASLPERQRQAVVLRHIEGLSNPEIAEILEVGVDAVESLTARGKRALKSALEGRKETLGYGT